MPGTRRTMPGIATGSQAAPAMTAALPRGLAPERLAVAAPGRRLLPVAVWLWADAVAANSTAVARRQSAPEMCRIGVTRISCVVSLGPGRKSCGLSAGPKVLGRRIVSKAPRAVNCRWPATGAPSGVKGSTWNRADGSSPLNHPARRSDFDLHQTSRLWVRGPGVPRGTSTDRLAQRIRLTRAFRGGGQHPGRLRTHDSH